jgi:hypothetical protein
LESEAGNKHDMIEETRKVTNVTIYDYTLIHMGVESQNN